VRFLTGNKLTHEMKRLVLSSQNLKIAVAYWGKHALTLLKLNPRSSNLRVLCCLKGGKSDPDIIAKFGKRAKQLDKLHAKVIWTPSGAIVGSGNASSNGLPEEEDSSDGLIEAGVFLDNKKELDQIERWFDTQYGSNAARSIKKSDLDEARKRRLFRGGSGPQTKREIVDIPLEELKKCKLGVLVYAGHMTSKENNEVKRSEFPFLAMKNVDWYSASSLENARKYPKNDYMLVYETSLKQRQSVKFEGLQQFPPQTSSAKIKSEGEDVYLVWSLDCDRMEVPDLAPFKFGDKSKKEIRSRLRERHMKLDVTIDEGVGESFLSWEPLYKLLGRHPK
jgi:hypothetical protein